MTTEHKTAIAADLPRRAWRKLIGHRDTKLLYAALADLCDDTGQGQVTVIQMINHTSLMGARLVNAIADLNAKGLATVTELGEYNGEQAYRVKLYIPDEIPPGGYAA